MNPKLPTFFKDPHILAQKDSRSPILIGLSGGADSSLLLYLLRKLKEERDFPLYAAHVNHGIRTEDYGNEAKRDEDFCRSVCREAGIPLFVASLDVPALAGQSGKSLETAARDARYAFFADIMNNEGIEILATAHNADDNLETQIFNLCRGCGISGICGIPEMRALDGDGRRVAIRPILSAKKSEVLDFCREKGVPYISDSTNLENDCTRNRIRNIIIPELNSIFNSPQSAALRLSRAAKEDNLYLKEEAERFLNGRKVIPASELSSLPTPIAKRALISMFDKIAGVGLEEVHIDAILDLIRAKKSGYISLPSKIRARISDGKFSFEAEGDEKRIPLDYSTSISEGLTFIDRTPYAVALQNSSLDEKITQNGENYRLYAQAYVKGLDQRALTAGSRREGEVILDGGMHKKLKKLMCDKKLPQDMRSVPIIREGNEAIYVPNCAVSDRAKAKERNAEYVIGVYVKLL